MKLTSVVRTFRHIRRYRQILMILLKYGFTEIVDAASHDLIIRFGERFIPHPKSRKKESRSRGERMTSAIDELGPTFIKMGQILSLRPDLIPIDIAYELQKLQDKVSPIPFCEIVKVIRDELKREPEEVFEKIEPEPLAAASIAQVHHGVLKNGQEVVLKVQRPNARTLIDVDLEILTDFARILQKYFRDRITQDPVLIVREFDKSIHRELNFYQEGLNIEHFGRCFKDDKTIFIPKYFSEYSTGRLLVMDYIRGIKASDVKALDDAGLDRSEIAHRATNLSFRQIFEFGFFHADPHPGNIMVLENNVIALLDYGMVGQIDENNIDSIGDIIVGATRKEIPRILRAFSNMGMIDRKTDKQALALDLENFIDNFYGVPLKEIHLSTVISEFAEVLQKYRLRIPPRLSLTGKAIITAEGLARMLCPEFDIMAELKPYIRQILMRRYNFKRKIREGVLFIDDFNDFAREFPEKMRTIMNDAADGKFTIQFEHRNLEQPVREVRYAANRLSSALIIAALIVGSSLLISVSIGPNLFGYPMLGMIGYMLAGILGIKLIWDIIRTKKSD